MLLLALGLVGLVLAGLSHHWIPLVAGTLLAGAGHGVAALAAQHDLTRIAPEEQRGEVAAAFYVCIYLGVSLPVIGIGVLAAATTLFTAVTVFATVTGRTALAVAAWHWRSRNSSSASAR